MDIVALILLTLCILIVGLFILIIVMFRRDIHAFFNPHQYRLVEMLQEDNQCIQWLEKINDNLEFKFNNGVYYMYDIGEDIDRKD